MENVLRLLMIYVRSTFKQKAAPYLLSRKTGHHKKQNLFMRMVKRSPANTLTRLMKVGMFKNIVATVLLMVCLLAAERTCAQTIIASDGLNNSSSLFAISGTGGSYIATGSSAASERPQNAALVTEGTHAYAVNSGTARLMSSVDINTSAYCNVVLSFRVAAFSLNTSNGMDGGDSITVRISSNGGTSYSTQTYKVIGNDNAYWDYTATGVASFVFGTSASFQPAAGGLRTTDGYTMVNIASLPSIANLRILISVRNNDANERWIIDDIKITGTSIPAAPAGASSQSFCASDNPTIASLSATGSNIKWYDAATGGNLLTNSTPLTNGSHYYASQMVSGCESATRFDVIADISTPSVGGSVSSNQTICTGSAPADLVLSGNTGTVVKWQRSTSADFTTGVTDIANTTTTLTGASIGSLTTTAYFRAVVKNGACAEASSAPATIAVNTCTGNYYVNDNSQLGDTYTSAVGNDANPGTWDAPFRTIAKAISVASAGATIKVDAGTYIEQTVVDKSLTILGVNAATNPCSITTTAESIIMPSTSQPFYDGTTEVRLMQIEASNVTVKGFTFDGNNPALAARAIDAADGIDVYEDEQGITIQNNVFRNLNEAGVTGYASGTTALAQNVINNNRFDNIPGEADPAFENSGYGIGVLLYNNFYATVDNNCMTAVRIGVQTGNFNRSNTGATAPSISNNAIQSKVIGIWHNLHYQNASAFTINNNNLTTAAGSTENEGLFISSLQETVAVNANNNNVTGAKYGIELWNNPTSGTVTVNGGTLTNCEVGIFANNYDGYNADAASSAYTVNNVSIQGSSVAGIYVKDNALNTNAATVSLQVTGNTLVNNTATGLRIEGGSASAGFTGPTPATFTGQAKYIDLVTNGSDVPAGNINATAVSFDGQTGATATLAQNFGIEDKMAHKIDNLALGFVRVNAGNAYVTPNSFVAPATTAPSVQRGVDAATAGDNVNVQAGTYNENVAVNKGLTLKGANFGVSCTSGRSAESIVTGTGVSGSQTFNVTADNVVINGFAITNPAGSYGISATSKNNLQVLYNVITNVGNATTGSSASYGVYFEAGSANSSAVNVSNNCISDIRGGTNTSLTGNDAKSNNGSGGGVFVGSSTATAEVTGLIVSANKISNIRASIVDFTQGGKGAYGVLINAGASPSAAGKAVSPQITANEIDDLEGFWAHGIGLEGETPDAVVTNNAVSNLTDHKTPVDAIGVMVEQNDGAATVQIANNSFTNTALSVKNLMAATVNAECNWHGTANSSAIAAKISGNADYTPFLNDGTDNDVLATGFQPAANTCSTPALAASIAAQTNVDCFGNSTGSVTVAGTGGNGVYQYSIDGTNYQASGTFNNLAAGPYTVTVKDGENNMVTQAVNITQPTVLTLNTTKSNVSCNGGSNGTITATGGSGTPAYQYSLSGPVNTPYSSNGSFTNLPPGTYTVSVKDANGCVKTTSVTITQPAGTTPDGTVSAPDYSDNFFPTNSTQNTIIFQVNEIGGNPMPGALLRITKQAGYTLSLPNVSSLTLGSGGSARTYTVDNGRWTANNSNPIFWTASLNGGQQIGCGQSVYLAVTITRATPSKSTFVLTSQVRDIPAETAAQQSNNATTLLLVGQ